MPQRQVKELNDQEIREIVEEIRQRMLKELPLAKVQGFFGLNIGVCQRFLHHTWMVIREKIEGEADAKERN